MKKVLGILSLLYKIYIALLFLVTAIIAYPLLVFTTTRETLHNTAFKIFAIWSYIFRFLAGWYVQTKGIKPPKNKPYIIVANHASYADILLLPSILSNYKHVFLGKSEILSYPIIKYYFKNYNIPVYRNNKLKAAKSLILAKKKVQKGWSIMIFPEGGIPDHEQPKLLRFKDGAFRLAKDVQVPILPITLKNHFKLFSEPTDIFGPASPGIAKVVFHEIIDTSELQMSTVEQLRQKCFETIHHELIK